MNATPWVAVVGGGPAGLMAAEVLATNGLRVVVFDRMPSVGRKFLLAGRGGLNLTHSESAEMFLSRYGTAAAVLRGAVEAFGPDDLRRWATALGETTFVGTSGRVFPKSFRATPLLRAWLVRLAELGVDFRPGHTWRGWTDDGCLVFVDALGTELTIRADATLLALGGATWPRTGSDGRWIDSVRAGGVDVAPLRPANCGFVVSWPDQFSARFAGHAIKNVAVTHGGRTVRGELMITSTGVEGGAIYAIASSLRDATDAEGQSLMSVDLKPDVPLATIAHRIDQARHRRPKDSQSTVLKRACGLQPAAVALVRELAAPVDLTNPAALAQKVKALPLTVHGTQSIDRAISTAGGVAFSEIDDEFMLRSKPGTFVAGEMLDWEAPTGGYLLQGAFSTGAAAAHGVLAWLNSAEGE